MWEFSLTLWLIKDWFYKFSSFCTGMSAGSSASSPLGNSILPPEDFSPSAAVSPLQRMASITNALISQPSAPHHHSPSQRPLKAVLPPITQQQFDQFNNLNTEEIVRKVRNWALWITSKYFLPNLPLILFWFLLFWFYIFYGIFFETVNKMIG